MVTLDTLREMLAYCDWANERILERAAALSAAQLDQPQEMGLGSLRRTLRHILAGEDVWLQRWQETRDAPWPNEQEALELGELRQRFAQTRQARDAWLAQQAPEAALRGLVYRDSRGTLFHTSLGDMWLQMCVHSMHHRAQAMNMLRVLGAAAPPPGLDYLFFRLQMPAAPAPLIALGALRRLYAYGDQMQGLVLEAAAALRDERLSQSFEMGLGTLRRTLSHIRAAEHWWLENWTRGPGAPFPAISDTSTIAELRQDYEETAAVRNRYIATLTDDDMMRTVKAVSRSGAALEFPLGVTMLQLCHHGVHHRAQSVNMVKRLGGPALELDYMYSVRKPV